jgi:hypothetical protein
MWYFDSALIGKFEQIETLDSSGWIILQVLFNSIYDAKQILMWLGRQIEVLDPIELRQEIIDSAKATLDFYEGE